MLKSLDVAIREAIQKDTSVCDIDHTGQGGRGEGWWSHPLSFWPASNLVVWL